MIVNKDNPRRECFPDCPVSLHTKQPRGSNLLLNGLIPSEQVESRKILFNQFHLYTVSWAKDICGIDKKTKLGLGRRFGW